jgi:tetratricopeptide (TPR) repeat protein
MTVTFARWTALLALLASSAAHAEVPPTMDQAVGFYEAMDDVRAAAAFEKILRGHPPGEVAAKAHLYLGVIAFNAFHPDQARAEFQKAIEANPAIDLPRSVSPKAAISFAEARRAVTRELEVPDATPEGTAAASSARGQPGRVAPPAATTATAQPSSGGIPAGSWWLGGFGLAALGAGTVLGVLSNGISSQDSYPKTPYHTISFSAAQTAGDEALTADVLFCAGGALLLGSVIWALTGSTPARASPSSPIAVAF